MVQCSWFLKAFLVVVHESPRCQGCLEGWPCGQGRCQGQWTLRNDGGVVIGCWGSTMASSGGGCSGRGQDGVLTADSDNWSHTHQGCQMFQICVVNSQ